MSQDFSGRVALVTGASRGIGRAVAKRFAALGAQVVCVARTQGALEELDDEITQAGGKAILVPQNLTDFDGIDRIGAALFERFGRLDILVGNAGELGTTLAPVPHTDVKAFRRVFDVNVTANFRLIRAMDPLLRLSNAGRAIFTTSGAARQAFPYWGAYGASKRALEGLVLSWAAEIAAITQVRVNLIDPGVVATTMRALAFPGENPATLTQPDAITPLFVELAAISCEKHGEIVHA